MNKVFTLSPREGWIVDRMVNEWNVDNSDMIASSAQDSDVIWLLADWCWRQIPIRTLSSKKVLTTVHHIVPEKFTRTELLDFEQRDSLTTAYHVYNQSTYNFINKLTEKPIYLIHYWANQKIWRSTGSKQSLRLRYNIPNDKFIVGSFQRDTEGHDLISPKLEKGPDLLVDFLEKLQEKRGDVFVVLAGWRRQYVIRRLEASKIPYVYFERPEHECVNDLYQCLDLYPVTARTEGGPQALIECGLLSIPVVSREVGIAGQVLPSSSINDDVFSASAAVPNVEEWKLPTGYLKYRKLIHEM